MTTLCEKCYPGWMSHKVLSHVPLTGCVQCGQHDDRHKGGLRCHAFCVDPRVPPANKPKLDLRDMVELKADADRAAARYKVPPCQECGAATLEEAYKKCRAAGDRDHCHGCDLWVDPD